MWIINTVLIHHSYRQYSYIATPLMDISLHTYKKICNIKPWNAVEYKCTLKCSTSFIQPDFLYLPHKSIIWCLHTRQYFRVRTAVIQTVAHENTPRCVTSISAKWHKWEIITAGFIMSTVRVLLESPTRRRPEAGLDQRPTCSTFHHVVVIYCCGLHAVSVSLHHTVQLSPI